MIDDMVLDKFLHSPLLENDNIAERVWLKDGKDYAEFKKEALNFCSDWLKGNRFVQVGLMHLDGNNNLPDGCSVRCHCMVQDVRGNYDSFVGDASTLDTRTVYICINIPGETSWVKEILRQQYNFRILHVWKRVMNTHKINELKLMMAKVAPNNLVRKRDGEMYKLEKKNEAKNELTYIFGKRRSKITVGPHHLRSSFRHYVFTQILHCSHAVLDCVSLKAQVWTCPDRLTSLEQARLLTFAACAFWRNHECLISANTCRFFSYIPLMPYKSTQLPESCKGYHRPSTDLHVKYLSRIYFYICLIDSSFRHYVFTQILRCSHAVLDCASLKAEVWSYPDMSGLVDQSGSSVWNRGTGAAVDQLPGCSASFLFTLIISSGYLASHFD
ncbi:hypothetical protein T10_705 [Trichinella papuae]|uniref:Uncharacterized protein n=1 Tax=Trichinella papuae TaxID=268474 RepID=A0A0V1M1Z5_9BILA|nr:hypothetical protein T10_705 [Trichinella papuae]